MQERCTRFRNTQRPERVDLELPAHIAVVDLSKLVETHHACNVEQPVKFDLAFPQFSRQPCDRLVGRNVNAANRVHASFGKTLAFAEARSDYMIATFVKLSANRVCDTTVSTYYQNV